MIELIFTEHKGWWHVDTILYGCARSTVISSDRYKWCEERFGDEFGIWYASSIGYAFKNQDDATLFQLTWG